MCPLFGWSHFNWQLFNSFWAAGSGEEPPADVQTEKRDRATVVGPRRTETDHLLGLLHTVVSKVSRQRLEKEKMFTASFFSFPFLFCRSSFLYLSCSPSVFFIFFSLLFLLYQFLSASFFLSFTYLTSCFLTFLLPFGLSFPSLSFFLCFFFSSFCTSFVYFLIFSSPHLFYSSFIDFFLLVASKTHTTA